MGWELEWDGCTPSRILCDGNDGSCGRRTQRGFFGKRGAKAANVYFQKQHTYGKTFCPECQMTELDNPMRLSQHEADSAVESHWERIDAPPLSLLALCNAPWPWPPPAEQARPSASPVEDEEQTARPSASPVEDEEQTARPSASPVEDEEQTDEEKSEAREEGTAMGADETAS